MKLALSPERGAGGFFMADTQLRRRGRKRQQDVALERRMIVSEKFRLCGQRNMTRIAEQLNVNVSTISRDWAWLDEHYKQVAAENVQIALGEWRKTHDYYLALTL